MSAEWRSRVLAEVDAAQDEMAQRLAQLVRVPSVGGSAAENEIQAVIAGILDSTGMDVDHWQVPLDDLRTDPAFPGMEVPRSEAWGLVGRVPGAGDGPALMINGHIDVVPPGEASAWRTGNPYSGQVIDGSLYGRGACDMKAGVVAGLWALTAIRRARAPLRGDLLLAPVQGEEDGGLGTFALLQRGWRADACIITEPTRLAVVPANAGALTFRITVRGLAAHGSRRTEGVSAIEKLWPVWRAVQAVERKRNAVVHPLFDRHLLAYPISLGTISGGVWPSSVPDVLVVEGRLGVALDEPVEAARAALADALRAAGERDLWLREHPVELEWWGGQFASGRLPAGHPLLDRVRAAHRVVTGGETPDVWGAPYGSDLRLMQAAGVPTVQYGPGDVDLAHATDESVPLDEVHTAARTLAVLALDHCGV